MAAPIQKVIRQEPVQSPLESKHPSASEELQLLVEELHQSGILEAARAMLGAKESIAKILVEQLLRKDVLTLINNVMAAGTVLTKLDPGQLERLTEGLNAGVTEANETIERNQSISIMGLLKTLQDPDVNRALQFAIGFLKGLGKTI
ncbi:helical membrane plugin domain-containing protein [Alicyclobacillus mengziensis]|uniref:DUF1641 domain-containing protein n=1 Tax=Alicyclobacillus mengziensis TaxID=2931921 RepID=A0A9X7VZ42_9BACL|nr:DUF1641 domain-containing protein [Alicyclobacillus mengziensis]QSO47127.1 DUF1641 domain-containing protein [Alicyclobacillus mengziensis]